MSTEMMSKLKAFSERRKTAQSGSGAGSDAFLKVDYGETKVRFLPDKNGKEIFFKEFGEHWVEKKPYICPKITNQDPCPICEAVNELYNGTEEDVELARTFKARRQHYANLIVVGKETEGPKVFKFGIKLADKLIEYSLDEDYYDLSDPEKGFNFRIDKKKKDSFPNYDSSKPVKDSTSLDPEDLKNWLNAAVDVVALVDDRVKPYDEIKASFTGVSEHDDATDNIPTESFNEKDFMSRVEAVQSN